MRVLGVTVVVAAFLLVGACSDDGTSGNDDDDDGTSTGTGAGQMWSPAIVSVQASPGTLGPGQTATVTVVVSDENGTADIALGVISNANTGVSYGSFTPGAVHDSVTAEFTTNLSWDGMNAVEPISWDEGLQGRQFTITFSDQVGQEASDQLDLYFECDPSDWTGCSGVCVDLLHDEDNCFMCGDACDDGDTCVHGSCEAAVATTCRYLNDPTKTCEDLCNLDGFLCIEGCGPDGDAGLVGFATEASCTANAPVTTTDTCDTTFYELDALEQVRCCCDEGSSYP